MIHIGIAFDESMALPAIALIHSIRRFHGPADVTLHIGSAGILPETGAHIDRELATVGLPAKRYEMTNVFAGLTGASHLPESAFYRCLLLDGVDVERCIYLDSDILVLGPLDDLYSADLQNFILGAVEGTPLIDAILTFRGKKISGREYLKAALGMTADWSINSGVMVVDTRKWRDAGMTSRIARFCADHPDTLLVEQDAINALLDGQIMKLDSKWNAFPTMAYRENIDSLTRERIGMPIDEYLCRAVVVHFIFKSKPWEPDSTPTDFDGEYWDVIEGTPTGDLMLANFAKRLRELRARGGRGLKQSFVETGTREKKLARALAQTTPRQFLGIFKRRWVAELMCTSGKAVSRLGGSQFVLAQWLSHVGSELYEQAATISPPNKSRQIR